MPARRACQKCGKNRAEKFYTSARGRICSFCRKRRVQRQSRDVRLEETYGITVEDYDRMLAAQGGGCAICGKVMRYNLDVDHDHALQRKLLDEGWSPQDAARASVRGLCCKQHNRRLLPSCRDDVGILRAAIEYLQDPPARHVLSTAGAD